MKLHSRLAFSLLLPLLMAGCSYMPEWMGVEEDETPLSGERLSILPDRQQLQADPAAASASMELPAPELNGAWYQGQAIAEDGTTILRHVKLGGGLTKKSDLSDPAAPDEGVRLTSGPLVIGDSVVILDGEGRLSACPITHLSKTRWEVDLNRLAVEGKSASGKESYFASWFASADDFIGGNISFVEGYVIAATANGHVFAIDMSSGKVAWHRALEVAIPSAPAGRNGLVYVVTAGNQLYALSLKDGATQWTHNGVPEQTKILSAASPVPLSETVIVPYSSGEVVALKTVNGLKLWDETLSQFRSGALGYQFSDIVATPVNYAGRVFVATDGEMAAIDVMAGRKIWKLPVTLTASPWVAGEWAFAVTAEDTLVAARISDGAIRWVVPLPRWEDEKKHKDPIRWSGPVLADDTLLVVGSNGELRQYAATDGTLKQKVEVEEGVLLPPVVAQGRVFLLNNDADLMVLE